ncbi:MAG: hypothetical protein GVY22_16845 [Gammaproteobacteria bacterium]|jgi:hypothetical protein|nr:hypothetical protein [Gammaproteobacteria bacterium]
MRPLFLLILIFAAVLLIQTVGRDTSTLETRLATMEARLERLSRQIEQLEKDGPTTAPSATAPAPEREAQPAVASNTGDAVAWRLGARVDGEPLRVAARSLDRARDRVELLLEIKTPLDDATAWPRQQGQLAPVSVVVQDSSGSVIAEMPMTLLRGLSHEPGRYLHLGAQLPEQVGARANLIEIR